MSRTPVLLLLASLAIVLTAANSLQAQLPNPIMYLPFNAADAPGGDFSDNGNGGTFLGGASWVPGGGGHTGAADDGAADFGAFNNGAYLNIGNAANGGLDSISTNDAVTVSFWQFGGEQQPVNNVTFRARGPENQNRIIGAHSPWGNGTVFWDVGGCCAANVNRISGPADEADFKGSWTHYAFVKGGTDISQVYINGALFLEATPGAVAALQVPDEMTVGSAQNGGNSYAGMLDDFAMWDIALTAQQIADLANGTPVPNAISLRGDFNGNGSIDEPDFNILAANLGGHLDGLVLHADGDFNLNGTVDLDDFGGFKAAFPIVVASALGVPEPGSVALAVVAACGLSLLGRRRS